MKFFGLHTDVKKLSVKPSFFTPKTWVELSQKYLADVFGKDWQDEYYVWDCAAGTGNLLAGLTNKYNIWASTLDKTDVDVMKERIHNGASFRKLISNLRSELKILAEKIEPKVYEYGFLREYIFSLYLIHIVLKNVTI